MTLFGFLHDLPPRIPTYTAQTVVVEHLKEDKKSNLPEKDSTENKAILSFDEKPKVRKELTTEKGGEITAREIKGDIENKQSASWEPDLIAVDTEQDDLQPTNTYLKIQRSSILKEIEGLAENYTKSLGTVDSAMFYSSLKQSIAKLWKYVRMEESLTMGLVAIDSALKYNKWNELDQEQSNSILKTIKIIVKDNDSEKDIRNAVINLQKSHLNLFPYEEE